MFLKKIACLTALSVSAIASFTYAGSAHAIGFTYDPGSYRQASATSEGVFSKNVNEAGYTTFDFNNGQIPGNDRVKYSFSSGSYSSTAYSGQTGIYSDVWAPSGAHAEVNQSNYLAVFQGNDTIIESKGSDAFTYFGFDAGALSGGNTLKFFNGATLIKEFTYDMMNAAASVGASQHGGQKNGFFEFFSQDKSDTFNKIVISQTEGGGFESDNHTFRVTSVPEPSVTIGMLAVGGLFLRKRKNQKLQSAKESA
ncbi:PEP-CTERM sorting domain-containing protein [Nostocaceae cyanobacterium CENA369]|uniref:PEP-CTERM sorting domain-containing protein n=1 Tax=Dendronalium phyllosphericum CENA369 TaxID=1725256 RepID=A0A8J7I3W6_9NOST|nr:PEP-CTERM sorting domain-containing protein [Dendronalium phyllosphericum]MBH8572481.1 PEP-CTERM sorting domain-containing protein [Dendronalium phyllosphericum CENA369]